jgi:hypothetical protein
LPGGGLAARVEASIQLLGPTAERADDAARRDVAVEREHVARARGEELGERVLQQGKRPRLMTDIGDDLRYQARFEPDADALRRALDRLRELVLGRGRDGDHARAQQLAELRVSEWMVEEVRTQSEDDAHRRTRVAGKRSQPVEEPASRLLVRGQREQLLELVDDEHERTSRRQDPLRDTAYPELVARKLLDEVVGSLHRDAKERR